MQQQITDFNLSAEILRREVKEWAFNVLITFALTWVGNHKILIPIQQRLHTKMKIAFVDWTSWDLKLNLIWAARKLSAQSPCVWLYVSSYYSDNDREDALLVQILCVWTWMCA